MPVQPTYPGVYIEEIPSGVRTITGVATSITAFVGTAVNGPVNEPVTIFSFGDYERKFGGLALSSTMSYAVQDFYMNGGSQALIIRIAPGAEVALVSLGPLVSLQALYPGEWANGLLVSVDHEIKDPTVPTPPAPVDVKHFNLTISQVNKNNDRTILEKYLNVSLDQDEILYLPRVLEQHSNLLRAKKNAAGELPVSLTAPPVNKGAVLEKGTEGTTPLPVDYADSQAKKTGIYALEQADLFNLLCIPPAIRGTDTHPSIYQKAKQYCQFRRAVLIVDPPISWGSNAVNATTAASTQLGNLNLSGDSSKNAAIFFPCVTEADPLRKGQVDTFVPCGIVAGIMARTDTTRGVWKTPAGIDASMNGIQGLQVNLTDNENGVLNQMGINCLRTFPLVGSVVWGGRTLRGADVLADEYKYLAVRRTALFIEESLYRGTKWVVFEPNDEPLWSQIRLNVGAFMHNLFRQGAFQGATPNEAYLVKCDKETTTQNDINLGIVNILVGFKPLKPAEFVIIKIQQLAGQIDT